MVLMDVFVLLDVGILLCLRIGKIQIHKKLSAVKRQGWEMGEVSNKDMDTAKRK